MKYPIGILENMLFKVKKIFILINFLVLEMEKDKEIPIIFGCPFLATIRAIIDVKNGKLTLNIDDK